MSERTIVRKIAALEAACLSMGPGEDLKCLISATLVMEETIADNDLASLATVMNGIADIVAERGGVMVPKIVTVPVAETLQ